MPPPRALGHVTNSREEFMSLAKENVNVFDNFNFCY